MKESSRTKKDKKRILKYNENRGWRDNKERE